MDFRALKIEKLVFENENDFSTCDCGSSIARSLSTWYLLDESIDVWQNALC